MKMWELLACPLTPDRRLDFSLLLCGPSKLKLELELIAAEDNGSHFPVPFPRSF